MTTIEHVPAAGPGSSLAIMGDAFQLAERIARTDFVPKALQGNAEAVMACILTGHEVGIGAMQSLAKIHVIEGRPAMSAELMRALVLRDGHELWFEDVTNTKVTICGKRSGGEHVTRISWTMDDAKRAGLEGRQNWRKFPRAMLEARATGELCRMIFADVLGGISYVKEELEDGDLFEPTPDEDDPPPPAQTRKAAPARKSAAKKAPAPQPARGSRPTPEPPLPPLPGEGDDVDDAAAVQRAQQIAMKARDAGLDHHHVVEAVTCGQKTSAKDVTAEEGGEVLMAIRDIAAGRKRVEETEHGRRLVVVGGDDDPAEPDLLDEEEDETEDPDAGSAVSDGQDEEERRTADAAPSPPAAPTPPAPPEPAPGPSGGTGDEFAFGEEASWDGDRWRAFLKANKVTVTDALREAQRLAREIDDGTPIPTRLDSIKGHASLALLLRGFIDELVDERGVA